MATCYLAARRATARRLPAWLGRREGGAGGRIWRGTSQAAATCIVLNAATAGRGRGCALPWRVRSRACVTAAQLEVGAPAKHAKAGLSMHMEAVMHMLCGIRFSVSLRVRHKHWCARLSACWCAAVGMPVSFSAHAGARDYSARTKSACQGQGQAVHQDGDRGGQSMRAATRRSPSLPGATPLCARGPRLPLGAKGQLPP